MNENERTDSVCRDKHDNCPTEGAVLQREWRQKTATIAMLEKMTARFGASSTELHDTLRSLYTVLRDRHHGRMPEAVQAAYDKAGDLLRRYETLTPEELAADKPLGSKNAPAELWCVIDADGQPEYVASWSDACHEHINDAIQGGDLDAHQSVVRRYVLAA